jgi:hypothetical protein
MDQPEFAKSEGKLTKVGPLWYIYGLCEIMDRLSLTVSKFIPDRQTS